MVEFFAYTTSCGTRVNQSITDSSSYLGRKGCSLFSTDDYLFRVYKFIY